MVDPTEFFRFGYHLKIKETTENESLDYFLKDQAKNELQRNMISIINANKWDAQKNTMQLDDDVCFYICQECPDDPLAKTYLQYSKFIDGQNEQIVQPFLDQKLNPGHTIKLKFRLNTKGLTIETIHGHQLVSENG